MKSVVRSAARLKRRREALAKKNVRAPRAPAAKAARDLILQATKSTTFVHSPLGTQIAVKGGKFRVTLDSFNRETGEPCWLRFNWKLPPLLATHAHALDWIYACVRDAWVHELNETLFVDGKRRRELHDEDGCAIAPPGEDDRSGDLASFKVQLAAFLSGSAPVTGKPQSELDVFKVQLAMFLMGAS